MSTSCRVSNSEHSSKNDGINLRQVLAECLGDAEARRKGELSASGSLFGRRSGFIHYTERPVRIPLALTSSAVSRMRGRKANLLHGRAGCEARSAQCFAFEGVL